MSDKIIVDAGSAVSLHSFGPGAACIVASFVCGTKDDAVRLQAAIEALVERQPQPQPVAQKTNLHGASLFPDNNYPS